MFTYINVYDLSQSADLQTICFLIGSVAIAVFVTDAAQEVNDFEKEFWDQEQDF